MSLVYPYRMTVLKNIRNVRCTTRQTFERIFVSRGFSSFSSSLDGSLSVQQCCSHLACKPYLMKLCRVLLDSLTVVVRSCESISVTLIENSTICLFFLSSSHIPLGEEEEGIKHSWEISTARLNTLLHLHLQPINVIVSNVPYMDISS